MSGLLKTASCWWIKACQHHSIAQCVSIFSVNVCNIFTMLTYHEIRCANTIHQKPSLFSWYVNLIYIIQCCAEQHMYIVWWQTFRSWWWRGLFWHWWMVSHGTCINHYIRTVNCGSFILKMKTRRWVTRSVYFIFICLFCTSFSTSITVMITVIVASKVHCKCLGCVLDDNIQPC